MVATKGLMDHLFMAACEWFLIFWMFIDAALAYSLTKFAKRCQLQIPCLLCSRLDHFFRNEERGSYSYLHLFCDKHQTDISFFIYCNLHNELVDAREMCEGCYNSFTLQRRSNSPSVSVPCSCCKSHLKEKSTGQRQLIQMKTFGSKVSSKVTTKPPLPRVNKQGRSKRIRNKTKNRLRESPYPVGYPELKFNSDSEFDFLFSDNDDGRFKVVDIRERGFKNVPDRNIFQRHSYSMSDLRPALCVDAQFNKSSRTRSASLTPNCLIQPKTEGFDPLKIMKYKKSLSSTHFSTDSLNRTDGNDSLNGSMIACSSGSQNRYNIFSRNSFSASDLGSAVFLEMHNNNKNLPRRSASLTPNSGRSFGEHKWPKNVPPKAKKNKKSSISSSSNVISGLPTPYGYGYLDDLVTLSNTNRHRNSSNIPRRHSYSVFQLGGDILLNMPNDESLTNCSASFAPKIQKGENDFKQLPPNCFRSDLSNAFIVKSKAYGSLDDSFVSRSKGNQYQHQNNIPRRHSYSFFELGCEILLNMPNNEGLTSRSASLAPNHSPNCSTGYNLKQPKNKKFANKKGKRNKKSFPSLNRVNGYGSCDDSFVSRNTGSYNSNENLRRHSYSAFELGCALLLNMTPINENANYLPEFGSLSEMQFPLQNMNTGYGSFDDSVVSRKKGSQNHNHNQNNIPRRHSYSVFQLGGDILLNMPTDESLSLTNCSASSLGDSHKPKFQKAEKDKKSLPPTGFLRSDQPIDTTRWHGFYDDYLLARSSRSQSQYQSQSQSNIARRHSHSAVDLGRALLVEIQLEKNLKSQHNRAHQNSKRDKKSLPPPIPMNILGSSSDIVTVSYDKTRGMQSLDDFIFSQNVSSHNQNGNPRRHSYSEFELGCALLLNMQRERSVTRRSASLTPQMQTNHSLDITHQQVIESQHLKSKKNEQIIYKPHGSGSSDDSVFVLSRSKDGQKQYNNLSRSCYSASDLTSPILLQMDESLTSKSASLTPNCSIDQSLGELNLLKFETGLYSSLQKRKKNDRPKAKKNKKAVTSANNVKVTSSSTEYLDTTDEYGSFGDSVVLKNTSSQNQQNRYNVFSRNSQSASDLGSLLLVEMHESSRTRSKSLTPHCYSRSPDPDPVSLISTHFPVRKNEENVHVGVGKDKKPLPDNDLSSNIKSDLCPSCLDKIDLRSLDGSEIDWHGGIERVKRKAEDDVRCMRLLQSELEAERNAATVAANHAMNMITRLQQEKASLQMEALQYLRMMEEQAEYDMEALQKANELVEEKENEIQDLLDELDQYRSKYGDESTNNVKSLEDEKKYILEALTTLEKKINELSSGVKNDGNIQSDHLNEENSLLTLEREISDMQEMMKGLQADVDLVKHVCNTLRGNEGVKFIEDIAHQLHDLRKIMLDRRYISSN